MRSLSASLFASLFGSFGQSACCLGNGQAVTSGTAFQYPLGRRDMFRKSVGVLTFPLLPTTVVAEERATDAKYMAYKITPDSSAMLNPKITALKGPELIKLLSLNEASEPSSGALWLGEHHNSERDHQLQAEFIRNIFNERNRRRSTVPMAIGLEQVQIQFQPTLDAFVLGKITEAQLKLQVDWERRWVWPFEVYRPIFLVARELQVPLVALNVNSEDLAKVEKNGLPGLPRARLEQYILDRSGFAEFAKPNEFKTYVEYVIRPSFELHRQMGLLKNTMSGEKLDEEMSFRNFFSGRILWDEAMASAAYNWTKENPNGLLIGLVGADHVKFRDGIPGRFARMAGACGCTSVILNPTLIDTRPPGSVAGVVGADSSNDPDRITLQLRYLKEGVTETPETRSTENTGGVLPLADYIVVS